MAAINFLKFNLMIKPIGTKTKSTNTNNAPYNVATSNARFFSTSNPNEAMEYANAPNTAKGAKYITMCVNLNITSERPPQNSSMGFLFSSLNIARAMENKILNTTTCST